MIFKGLAPHQDRYLNSILRIEQVSFQAIVGTDLLLQDISFTVHASDGPASSTGVGGGESRLS